jgi:capsid portal protein
MRKNRLGGSFGFRNSLAKYTRRGSDLDTYWFIQAGLQDHMFSTGSVCHVLSPDIHQEIYGMPEYFAGLSANLAHSADKFRKLYYDNGSHAGCIVYVNSAMADRRALIS